ncbi:hypothetical protein CALCODRAFT_501894 [Calocera cornea HHB12733]|uniref:ATP-dependent DNA helicase n=1 Tax=Calocera cornea HHB12733 TaxID=1353952 RepID=A0A165DGQ8_9BASI|nr:hypothetical protein CALCODRAFT_501894 [Calocera cornea HHB12733]
MIAPQNLEQGSLVNGSQGVVVGFNTPLEARDNGYELGRAQEADVPMWAQNGRVPKVSLSDGKVHPEELANSRWPIVKFNTGQVVLVQPTQFSVVNVKGKAEAQRDQVPLILAWALSVHKAQGQTLERVKIDLSEVFEKGRFPCCLRVLSNGLVSQGKPMWRFRGQPPSKDWKCTVSLLTK